MKNERVRMVAFIQNASATFQGCALVDSKAQIDKTMLFRNDYLNYNWNIYQMQNPNFKWIDKKCLSFNVIQYVKSAC